MKVYKLYPKLLTIVIGIGVPGNTTNLSVIGGIIGGIIAVAILLLITYFIVKNVRDRESTVDIRRPGIYPNSVAPSAQDTKIYKLYSMDENQHLEWL